jgi:hypothetical protein
MQGITLYEAEEKCVNEGLTFYAIHPILLG